METKENNNTASTHQEKARKLKSFAVGKSLSAY